MAMTKEKRREHNPVIASSPEASERAAQLAPPEELDEEALSPDGDNGGALNLDTGSLRLPDDYAEESRDDSRSFRPDPVVIIIFFLSLAFIAFITYLISIEPQQ
jgi:hypothetical protein